MSVYVRVWVWVCVLREKERERESVSKLSRLCLQFGVLSERYKNRGGESKSEPNYADQIFPEQLQIKYPDHICIPLFQNENIHSLQSPFSACLCWNNVGDGGGNVFVVDETDS